MGKFIDLTGQVFGELTVVSNAGVHKNIMYWLCACSCGSKHTVAGTSLRLGRCRSCGCHGVAGTTGQKQIYNSYKCNARARGYSFDLTREEVYDIIQEPCYYCGDADNNTFTNWYTREKCHYNGMDRVDNSKGYSSSNVVPCCEVCNKAKLTMSEDDYINHCNKVAGKWKKR